ncbi:3-phosphoshikimate 1-carboxyvinyltransferase [Buchnera aphidicola]|uniref:3-phosphoshikimate 1-carboxyvinyltransferase n=1 Tax=Buchnera aphidicola TaxID=9 RepID=UPI00346435FD
MEKFLTLNPISSVYGDIYLPGSKSISNRVLLMSAMSNGVTCIKNLLNSDDVNHMLKVFQKIGIKFNINNDYKNCIIEGCSGPLYYSNNISLFLGNAGTVMRPLTAAFSLLNNDIILTGDSRMQERPIKDLVLALRQGGAIIKYLQNEGYPPIKIQGGFLGGKIIINGNISSQFLTSLLISAPLAKLDTNITLKKPLISKPYVDITMKLMKNFGITVYHENYQKFFIKGNQIYYSPKNIYIEGDASSASYFLAAAAIKGKSVRVIGIDKNSIQGDIQFVNILKKMGGKINWGKNFVKCSEGRLKAIDLDANDIPDAAMTIAILALFTYNGKTTIIRNIYSWRLKETDRLKAMTIELKKIGAFVIEGKDYICITPPKKFIYAKINTYNDHRMAMCFSLIALSNQSVTIMNPKCVSKTFPQYFQEFNKISVYNSLKKF